MNQKNSTKAYTALSGIVKPFDGNGRKLGYPTANIEIPDDTPEGLFLGRTSIGGDEPLPAIIFIGAPTTLDNHTKRAEAHILNFKDRDLYGESIVIVIEKLLRQNQTYPSAAALIQQMKKDERAARQYFNLTDKSITV